MIGDILLTATVLLACATVAFALWSWKETRKRYYDEYRRRKGVDA